MNKGDAVKFTKPWDAIIMTDKQYFSYIDELKSRVKLKDPEKLVNADKCDPNYSHYLGHTGTVMIVEFDRTLVQFVKSGEKSYRWIPNTSLELVINMPSFTVV